MSDFTEIWVYLSSSPLLHLTLTLIAYQIGDWAYKRSGGLAILNPVLLAVAMLVAVLLITDTDYGTYFEGAKFVHFLLGPATVALAIPLYNQLEQVKALLARLALIVSAWICDRYPCCRWDCLGVGCGTFSDRIHCTKVRHCRYRHGRFSGNWRATVPHSYAGPTDRHHRRNVRSSIAAFAVCPRQPGERLGAGGGKSWHRHCTRRSD